MEASYNTYVKIQSSKLIDIYEKAVLQLLISYWKAYKKKGYPYIQKSYNDIMRLLGRTDPHIIQKTILKLLQRGLLDILNIEEVREKHHTPKIILKEKKINDYFLGDFFNTKQDNSSKKDSADTPVQRPTESNKGTAPGQPDMHRPNIDYFDKLLKMRMENAS